MKKNIYIKPASYILPSPLLLQAAQLSNQHIGSDDPDNPPVPIGGEGDPDDEGDARQRMWDSEGFGNSIPNSLW